MIVFSRGHHIVFRHAFYDTSGDLASPSSASLILAYPSSGWPYRGFRESTTLSMIQSTVGSTHEDYLTWSTTWASGASHPGPIYWSVRASDLSLTVTDGQFDLRANPANLTVTTTT